MNRSRDRAAPIFPLTRGRRKWGNIEMSKANKGFWNSVSLKNNDEAVSPVIGVILMVAVTVILAAVIAAFIFGFTGNMPKAPNVAYYQIERSGADVITVTPTNPSIVELTHVTFKYNGVDITTGTFKAGTPAVMGPGTDGILGTLDDVEISPAVPDGAYTADEITAALASGDGLSLHDSNPATVDTISVYASVSGLAVQLVQEVSC